MDLQKINEQLQIILEELPKAIKTLNAIEYEYNKRYYYVLAHSPAGSREGREADAILTCETEGLYKPFIDARVDVRTLTHEKELLIELSRNTRELRGKE